MKKLFALLLCVTFVLTSCSKDDDDSTSLDGTTWEAYEKEGDVEYKSTIRFHKSTFNYEGYETYRGVKDEFKGSGTYTYDHPNIVMTEGGETETVTIKDNKFVLGDNVIYTKK